MSTPERALALELLQFGEAIDFALRDYRPNSLTAWTLQKGIELLGIETVERM